MLMSDSRLVTMKHSSTAFVGVLFHSVMRLKRGDAGRPWSREKAHTRREVLAKMPKSAKEKMVMMPLSMAVLAAWLPVASWKTTRMGKGAASTVVASVMQYYTSSVISDNSLNR